ncbi:MAG: hypothetical protein GC165_07370 [Armatimonadetes bacterium]|nr:hypothetical protein [Armatimonadota bacterium]
MGRPRFSPFVYGALGALTFLVGVHGWPYAKQAYESIKEELQSHSVPEQEKAVPEKSDSRPISSKPLSSNDTKPSAPLKGSEASKKVNLGGNANSDQKTTRDIVVSLVGDKKNTGESPLGVNAGAYAGDGANSHQMTPNNWLIYRTSRDEGSGGSGAYVEGSITYFDVSKVPIYIIWSDNNRLYDQWTETGVDIDSRIYDPPRRQVPNSWSLVPSSLPQSPNWLISYNAIAPTVLSSPENVVPIAGQVALVLMSVLGLGYEFFALATKRTLISNTVWMAVAGYAPIAWFGGMVTIFDVYQIMSYPKPPYVLFMLVGWLIVLTHFFWQANQVYVKQARDDTRAVVEVGENLALAQEEMEPSKP